MENRNPREPRERGAREETPPENPGIEFGHMRYVLVVGIIAASAVVLIGWLFVAWL